MSDDHQPAAPAEPLFTATEIEEFDADDVTAGRAIGKMLSLLFLYTVVVMAAASWWTFSSVAEQGAPAAAVEAEGH
ncbi:MAG: hypothetical protein KDA85_03310 [Planctomycetaceae bacterium]|nr:hypothetical protein [Planctomycetaceae bacterium]